MSRSTGLPQHLWVFDLRPESADRIISYVRHAGLAVRISRTDTMEMAVMQMDVAAPDVVLVSFDGPPEWSFESAMSYVMKCGHKPLVVADKIDDGVVARAYAFGAQGVVPSAAPDAIISALRWMLSVSADRVALEKAEIIRAETAIREESLLDSSRDPVAYIHEGMHIKANAAYLTFFGIDNQEIEGLPFLDLVASESSQQAKACLKSASRGETVKDGAQLHLLSGENGSLLTHVEISSATYEGESCLQLTLRVSDEHTKISAPPSHDNVLSWWDRILLTHENYHETALIVISLSNPIEFLNGSLLVDRPFILDLLREAVWNTLLECDDERIDRHSFTDLGLGVFGVLFPPAVITPHPVQIGNLFQKLSSIKIEHAEKVLSPRFYISAIALGKSVGWNNLDEALHVLDKNIVNAKKGPGFIWFDPSGNSKEELQARRLMLENAKEAIGNLEKLIFKYKPVLPLNGEPIHFYQVCPHLIGSESEVIENEILDEVFSDRAALSRFTEATIIALKERVSSVRNPVKLLLPLTIDILENEKALSLLPTFSESIVISLSENDINSNEEGVLKFRDFLKRNNMDFCIHDFGLSDISTSYIDSLNPNWIIFDQYWSIEKLRHPEQQKVFRDFVQCAHQVNCQLIAGFINDTQTLSAFFSAGVDYAAGEFMSPVLNDMSADFSL